MTLSNKNFPVKTIFIRVFPLHPMTVLIFVHVGEVL